MGHANISITLDRYGHLMPGSEAEAAELLDTYLAAELDRSAEQARGATGERTGEGPEKSLASAGASQSVADVLILRCGMPAGPL
jgi:hypothetical protein